MISRLLNRLFPAPTPHPPTAVPTGATVYAIGDVHGERGLLESLIDRIRKDAQGPGAADRIVLVMLGDYVDRGPDSRGVIDLLLTKPLEGAEHRYLMGNHEQVMTEFLRAPETADAWLDYGGLATADSYGVRLPPPATAPARIEFRDALAAGLPHEHRKFLGELELLVTLGDYAFAHAGIDPRRPLAEHQAEELLWMREPFLSWTGRLEKRVVHGHTIRPAPEVLPNRIGLDTGAYATGVLTAVALTGTIARILQATNSD